MQLIPKAGVYRSALATKITKRMLQIYLSIYLLILILLFVFLTPHLYESANTRAMNTLTMICDEISNSQEQLRSFTDTVYSSKSLINYLSQYQKNPSDALFAHIEQELSTYVSSNSQLLAATLEDEQHTFFSSSYFRNVITHDFALSNRHYTNLFNYPSGSYFNYLPPETFKTADKTYTYHTLVFSKKITLNHSPYIITSYYNLNNLHRLCNNLLDGVFTGYAIIDRYQDVLYSSNPAWQADDFSLTTLFDYHKLKDSKSTFQGVYYYAQNPATGWFFISYAPYTLLLSNLFTVFGIITLLYLISPLLYGIFLIPTASRYLSPLTKLYDSMKYYKAGEQISLEIRTGDEIEELSNIYNQMIEKINNQIEDIKDKEHVNAVVNFKLLATQIDPHFIYNTMNIINIMARQGNSEAIIEINSSLIKILRERLNSKLTISDTIEHELETLYQYKLIMDYRYENKIKTTVSIDEALLQKKIPKNILQPLTENAFYHGFGNKLFEQEGCIDILIYSVGQELVIEVSDNGAGMSDERLAMLMNRSYHIYDDNKPHIGLDNIRQRLEYVYQGNYEFNISSNLGFGTTISITIPLEMPAA